MANKRMFSKDIVQSDAFLDMPPSTQALYFQLGMEADDDGFIGNFKKILRTLGLKEDDFKLLEAKRFILVFTTGVLVIKHHRINNNWDKHNSRRTLYLEELGQLHLKENRAYTLDKSQGEPVQSVFRLKPVFRLEENRVEENKRFSSENRFEYTIKETSDKEEKVLAFQEKAKPENKRVRSYFRDECKKLLGKSPPDSVAGATIVSRALTRISEEQCKEKIDTWLMGNNNDQRLMSITACFSDNEINGYLTGV